MLVLVLRNCVFSLLQLSLWCRLRRTNSFSIETALVTRQTRAERRLLRIFADKDEWIQEDNANPWTSSNDEGYPTEDWQDILSQQKDGTFWSSFEPSVEGSGDNTTASTTVSTESNASNTTLVDEEAEAEQWLDAIRSLTSEEVEFNLIEAERANTARQMEEWGFARETIMNALDIAVDSSRETMGDDDVKGMQMYWQQAFLEEVDLQTVESHTKVPVDEDTGEPFRTQMVYVDEHTCIGCTNCAMTAQSTFFMQQDHGRARVFQQWGDDDETIQIAIETCPVDCIHYVPFEELVHLEKERRNQNINFKARLVSQAENAMMRGGGSNAFTGPQRISGDTRARCANCPSRGCADCPMYGVGKNPEFERKEKERLQRQAMKKLREQYTAEL
jgi:ferredoxin